VFLGVFHALSVFFALFLYRFLQLLIAFPCPLIVAFVFILLAILTIVALPLTLFTPIISILQLLLTGLISLNPQP
jgi:hypothetical protein